MIIVTWILNLIKILFLFNSGHNWELMRALFINGDIQSLRKKVKYINISLIRVSNS